MPEKLNNQHNNKRDEKRRPPKSALPLKKGKYDGVYITEVHARTQQYPIALALEHIEASMKSIVSQREAKPRPVQNGAVSSLQPTIVTRNDPGATLAAIKKRLDVKPQRNVGGVFKKGYEHLMALTPPLKQIVADAKLIGNWMESLTPEKRERIEPILADSIYWQGAQDREVFAKQEVLLKPEGSAPRLIHNGNPIVNLMHGAITNELQRRAKMVLSERNPGQNGQKVVVYFPTGKTDKEVAEMRARLREGECEILEGDFKSNDATQPPELREYEAMWYKKLGAPDWYVRDCIELKEMNVFSRTLGLKLHIEGQRHSGEEAGTIGNSFNSACLLAGAILEAECEGSVMVYGDDTEAVIKRRPLSLDTVVNTVVAAVEEHGMEMEIATPPKEQATFLQTRVHETVGGEAVPVPKLGRYLAKVNVRANNNPDVGNLEYQSGKYLSLAHQFRYLPTLARRFLATSETLSATPHMAKDWNPLKKDSRNLAEEVVSVRRPLTSDEEERAMSTIYGLSLNEVTDTVDKVCASAILFAAASDPSGRARYRAALASLHGAGGVTAYGDIDTPAMARLVQVDNLGLLVRGG